YGKPMRQPPPAIQTWRSLRKRYKRITVEELRLHFDWSLPGRRLYGLTQNDRFRITAKLVIETNAPTIPCRSSEPRDVSGGRGIRRPEDFPCWDKSRETFPTGRFTTWLRHNEIEHALAGDCVIRCEEILISVTNVEHDRIWKRLRN